MNSMMQTRTPAQAMAALFEALSAMKDADGALHEAGSDRESQTRDLATFDHHADLALQAAQELRDADVLDEIIGFLTVLYDGRP